MEIVLSEKVQMEFPDLSRDVRTIVRTSQRVDKDIRTSGLLVTVRCGRSDRFSGTAFPFIESVCCITREMWSHADGKIHLTLGPFTEYEGLVRLVAHEARHIGQFHRTRNRIGTLGNMGPRWKAEEDAYAFEDRILDRLGT